MYLLRLTYVAGDPVVTPHRAVKAMIAAEGNNCTSHYVVHYG